MKKISLLLILFSFAVQAQTFPAPYCDIADTSVEEISSITFADASITNLDMVSILVDHTETIANLTLNDTYTISVEGNTYGDFDTNIVAFIDWNQNGVLDDENEIYEVGTLSNTTGGDGQAVSLDITVPADALLGNTRIRVTKVYTDEESVAVIDPCAISMSILDYGIFDGYGQAIDFTLNIDGGVAEEFPAPYCDIPDTTVEEISTITFADASITNMDTVSILVDQTDTVANLTPGETYTISVEGNTYGDFDTNIVAFIDWNQNGVLDDENEIYEVGTLSNTTGGDGVVVSLDISVPVDAVLGDTRIRVTKVYTDEESIAVIDPCAISMSILDYGVFDGFGQAVDFTVNIGSLSVRNLEVNTYSAYPVPTKDLLHIQSDSGIKMIQIYNLLGQLVFSQKGTSDEIKLDISQLTAGTYIVKLQTVNDQQQNFKIIKK